MRQRAEYRDPTPNNFPEDYDENKVDPRVKLRSTAIFEKMEAKDTRAAQAQGIEISSVVAGEAKNIANDTASRQDDVEEQFQDVIDNTTGKDVIAAPELIAARNGKPNLKTRIDDLENETNAQLAHRPNVIDVTNNGIKNDNVPIGEELNSLITQSYGKTLYFPDGVYNLTEPMVTPFEYEKNVHIIFSPSAVIRTDLNLSALLRVGFGELNSNFDQSQRRLNYISGGKFDCSNAETGIEVNGLKQLVSLKDMSLFKGKKNHIKIYVSANTGTGSSDTKIQNVTIQGLSSNEDSYGIYIDSSCSDCKLDNVFIYGCKVGIYTNSAGHYMNNVHILSQVTTGGLDLGDSNFLNTIGIQLMTSGCYFMNSVYFDTVDMCIYSQDNSPKLNMTNCFFFSYLDNFGTSFFKRDFNVLSTLELNMSNCSIDIKKQNYKIIDANIPLGYDSFNRVQLTNMIISNSGRDKLSKFDRYLAQKVRNQYTDFLVRTDNTTFNNSWVVLGLFPLSEGEIEFNVSYSANRSVKLNFRRAIDDLHYVINDPYNGFKFQLGKAPVVDDNGYTYTALVFKPNVSFTGFPSLTTIRGMGCFMRTPSDFKKFALSDYGIDESSIQIIVDNL